MDDHDLLEAIDSVTVRIRRSGSDTIVVTSPVAAYFKSDGDRRDMIARRDGWIVLADDDWHEWSLRAVGRQRDRGAPAGGDRLEILPPDTVPRLEELFYQIQVGTYTVADSPVLYPPRTYEIEQAAVWIADAGYSTLERGVEDPRIPPQYAVAFALVFCDLAGIDITDLQVWRDREAVFGVVRDQGLNAWYQVKTAGQVTR